MLKKKQNNIWISDKLNKAREKAKQAEIESEVESETGGARRRKKPQKLYDSDKTSDDSDDSIIAYPKPPSTLIKSNLQPTATGTNENENENEVSLTSTSGSSNTSKLQDLTITLPNISSLDLTLTPSEKEFFAPSL